MQTCTKSQRLYIKPNTDFQHIYDYRLESGAKSHTTLFGHSTDFAKFCDLRNLVHFYPPLMEFQKWSAIKYNYFTEQWRKNDLLQCSVCKVFFFK